MTVRKMTPNPEAFILPTEMVDAVHASQNFFILAVLITSFPSFITEAREDISDTEYEAGSEAPASQS